MLSYLIVILLFLFSNSSPLGFIEQTTLGKSSFLVAIKIESSWDRPVVPGFDTEKDDHEHVQGHDAFDEAGDPLHLESLPEMTNPGISSEHFQ